MTRSFSRFNIRVGAIVVAALLLSGLLPILLRHTSHRSAGTLVALVAAIVIARQRWGSVAVIAPAFLLPDVRGRYGISGLLQLAIVSLLLALVYWDAMGRPRLSAAVSWTAGVFSVALVALNAGHGAGFQDGLWRALLAWSGVLLGASIATDERARWALCVGCVPLALLAIAEIAGVHNPWPGLVHANTFTSLTQQPGAGRAQSTFSHPLIAGGCLATVAALSMQSRARFGTIVTALLVAGALATVSRSAIAGVAAGAVCGVVVGPDRRRRLIQAVVLLVVGLILVLEVPSLHQSFLSRTSNPKYTDQSVRNYAISRLRSDLGKDPSSLLVGKGTRASANALETVGGIKGYYIFDNQYVTSVYDFGLIPVGVILALVLCALVVASPRARQIGLPAVTAVAVVMFFTDGIGWLSLSMIAWTTFGLAAAQHEVDRGAPVKLSHHLPTETGRLARAAAAPS
jgi:hypothetical protein